MLSCWPPLGSTGYHSLVTAWHQYLVIWRVYHPLANASPDFLCVFCWFRQILFLWKLRWETAGMGSLSDGRECNRPKRDKWEMGVPTIFECLDLISPVYTASWATRFPSACRPICNPESCVVHSFGKFSAANFCFVCSLI